MVVVRKRKLMSYRPDDDMRAYIERMKTLNPDASYNDIIDGLVRYAVRSLKAEPVIMQLRTNEIKENTDE